MNAVRSFFRQNWVLAGEHFALRVGSFGFSMVSAHAILWFFNSLSMVQDSDPFQRFVPYVIAGGFGLLGYFVSRGLVYRMMRKERIRVYSAIVLLFEFVEIVCNFAQAVSSVPRVDWLSRLTGWPHDGLLLLLYIAYSIVPVVTFVLAAVDMDLEKEKLNALTMRAALASRSALGSSRATTMPGVPARATPLPVPVRSQNPGNGQTPLPPVPARSQGNSMGNGQPKSGPPVLATSPQTSNGNRPVKSDTPAPGNGWKFPFAKSGNDNGTSVVLPAIE